jgi:predicted RNA-binding protein YlxR (DUF448 family)
MSKKGHVPIRTCIGCRKRKNKEEMIGLIVGSERVIQATPRVPHPGRGIYLCADLGCFHMAKKKHRGIGFLETTEFEVLLAKRTLKGRERMDREEVNDKE